METTEVVGKLAAALARAQAEFTAVPKTKTAKIKTKAGAEYQYKFCDLADVLKMALPVLAKNEIAFTQPLKRTEGRLAVTTRISHSSGEFQQSDGIVIPENLDPQAFGSCLSYWRRYDGCSMLGIAPDEDDDGKLANDAVSAPARRAKPAQDPQATAPPKPPDSVSQGSGPGSGPALISEGQRRRMFALAREHDVNPDVLKDYLIKTHNFVSSRDVTKDCYEIVCAWIMGAGK